ncbi:hypothetical protein B0H13DRAFT_2034187 [Mycena leptocephala]|nr:hypothetical protein B0H13DRAFT_2034187 [Mycena leptocephala]
MHGWVLACMCLNLGDLPRVLVSGTCAAQLPAHVHIRRNRFSSRVTVGGVCPNTRTRALPIPIPPHLDCYVLHSWVPQRVMSTYLRTLGAHGLEVLGVGSGAGKVRSLNFLVRFLRGDGGRMALCGRR